MGKFYAMDEDEETLSFASMACHVSPSPESSRNPSPPGDPFFEFRPSPEISSPSSPADFLFSNGLLVPRSLPPEAGETNRRRCLKESAGQSRGGRLLQMSASKRVSFQLVARSPQVMPGRSISQLEDVSSIVRSVPKPPPEMKSAAEGRRSMFGLFKTACRECHALEPSSQVIEMPVIRPIQDGKLASPARPDHLFRIHRAKLLQK